MPVFSDQLPQLPSASEMHMWDKNAIEFGIPEIMLMENAGNALFSFVKEKFSPLTNKKFLLFMGGGNNGGDAACLARYLLDAHAKVLVFCARDPEALKGAAKIHYKLSEADGVDFRQLPNRTNMAYHWPMAQNTLRGLPHLIIDGLLGTDFLGPLKEPLANLIRHVNSYSLLNNIPILAIDAPSGLDCNTGEPSPIAIMADWTICLAAAKNGELLPQAKRWTGKVFEKQIGIPLAVERPASLRLLDGRFLLQRKSFPEAGFKNSYGHVLVIGGSSGLTGAPHLAALAALRSGAGLVSVCAPSGIGESIKAEMAEIMLLPAGSPNETQWPANPDAQLLEKINSMQALVIGPGMGRTESAANFLRVILSMPNRPPAVIDADALRLVAENKDILQSLKADDILTPHPGEAGALIDWSGQKIQHDREWSLRVLCRLAPAVFILKGAGTLVGQQNRQALLAPYDIPQMSIGGAGDVLSGCLGALLARRSLSQDIMEIAATGVIRHIMAGLACAEKFPERGALASELANELAKTEAFLEKFPRNGLDNGCLPWP